MELEQAVSGLAQKEKAFDETVSTEVTRGLYQENNALSVIGMTFTIPEIKPSGHCSVLWTLRVNSKSKHCFPAPR